MASDKDITLQPASQDIWQKKYQLRNKKGEELDKTVDDTFDRVAKSLADVEPKNKEKWHKEFLWAMHNGALPAGRIMSNAGAEDYKPNTTLLNCSVAAVNDDIDSIFDTLHKAAVTLKSGSGIGYHFGTLRPHGAFVTGVGATTSGPLPFMDIFSEMCFTISSAGGRRGAQMGTMTVGHPDIEKFIEAKKEDGRLRQFNLSVLVTDEFMKAVKQDKAWDLAFPLTKKEREEERVNIYDFRQVVWRPWEIHEPNYIVDDQEKVACKIYKTVRAKELWDKITASTYDYGEPGVIFVDRMNNDNNNYFDELFVATNPCVTEDTWVETSRGRFQVKDLIGEQFFPKIDGVCFPTRKEGFFSTGQKEVVRLETVEGRTLEATPNHLIHRYVKFHADSRPDLEWVSIGDLRQGDKVRVHNHSESIFWRVETVKSISSVGIKDVYDVQVPIVEAFDANGFYVHNCSEIPLPPNGTCLLGSVDLTKFVENSFQDDAAFNWLRFDQIVRIFTRMLDNVVDINGLPHEEQRKEILRKRRHGMGFLGLGSALTMMKIRYGSPDAIQFAEDISERMALLNYKEGLHLAKEKGPAPIMEEQFVVTPSILRKNPYLNLKVGDVVKGKDLWSSSNYMQKIKGIDPELVDELSIHGCRFTHATAIAPTGTLALSFGNNCSNGIEPTYDHSYTRNVIQEGKKTKEAVDVNSLEFLAYKHSVSPDVYVENLPDYFITANDLSPAEHIAMQGAVQYWTDNAVSKTVNCPTEMSFEHFKNVYWQAYNQSLKSCATFRYNPEVFQGVLVRQDDLTNTTYRFHLEDGESVDVKGNELVEYDGEIHTAANLFDGLKEKTYGKY